MLIGSPGIEAFDWKVGFFRKNGYEIVDWYGKVSVGNVPGNRASKGPGKLIR